MIDSLKGITSVNGKSVAELYDFVGNGNISDRPDEPIVVQHKNDGIAFKMGDDACNYRDLVAVSIELLEEDNDLHPRRKAMIKRCLEDAMIYSKLDEITAFVEFKKGAKK